MRPGPAALCPGRVWHKRLTPTVHEFTYRTHHVWLDPDRPDELCDLGRWWSTDRPAIVRFRPGDYGRPGTDPSQVPLGRQVREDLAPMLGSWPAGPIRMITQPRRWGWLFNPLTVYLAWDHNPDRPVGAVLEVTNTPWHERHRYAVALVCEPATGTDSGRPGPSAGPGSDAVLGAEFAKALHVSPFLDRELHYRLRIDDVNDAVGVALDVSDPDGEPVLLTKLEADRLPATRSNVAAATIRPGPATHRVSVGIHLQAARLWRKGVAFVPHPRRGERSMEGTTQ